MKGKEKAFLNILYIKYLSYFKILTIIQLILFDKSFP